jgi:hypothetical protein
MFLLELAWRGWPEDMEGDSPEGLLMDAWSRTVGHQAAVLSELEPDLSPEFVEEASLAEITQRIVETLRAVAGD